MNVMEILTKGIGSNFEVINPEDGRRKDNRVWFGTCSVCQDRVSNSITRNVWEHTVTTQVDGRDKLKWIDYCPEAE